jgi:hypothetical protein
MRWLRYFKESKNKVTNRIGYSVFDSVPKLLKKSVPTKREPIGPKKNLGTKNFSFRLFGSVSVSTVLIEIFQRRLRQ